MLQHVALFSAVSNAPEASKVLQNGTIYVVSKFDVVEPIPTHMVGFMISDLEFIEDTSGPVPLRVYGTTQALSNGFADMALEETAKLLKTFEEYLGVPYASKKFDQAAIPYVNIGKWQKRRKIKFNK